MLILDDFGLQPITHPVKLLLLQVLEDRYERAGTIRTGCSAGRPAAPLRHRTATSATTGRLRSALSHYLKVSREIPTEPDRLLITRGSQHAFQLACTLLFAGGGVVPSTEYGKG